MPREIWRRSGAPVLGEPCHHFGLAPGIESPEELHDVGLHRPGRHRFLSHAQRPQPLGHRIADPLDVGLEERVRREPQGAREHCEEQSRLWQRVGLMPGGELHPMLETPKREVGLFHLSPFTVGHEAARAKTSERAQRARRAKGWLSTAPDEQERLHEELCLANAPFANLQVARRVGLGLGAGLDDERCHLVGDPRVRRRDAR